MGLREVQEAYFAIVECLMVSRGTGEGCGDGGIAVRFLRR